MLWPGKIHPDSLLDDFLSCQNMFQCKSARFRNFTSSAYIYFEIKKSDSLKNPTKKLVVHATAYFAISSQSRVQ